MYVLKFFFFFLNVTFFKSMFKLINIFYEEEKCVDYISHFVFFFMCVCLYSGVCNTKVENTAHGMGAVKLR